MADAVDSRVLRSDKTHYTIHLTNISDGTGESAVAKIDKSALTGPDNTEPRKLAILSARWAIQGFTSVRLLFDHSTDDEFMVLANNGYENYEEVGGFADPASSGGTGDLLLTTAGAVSGATYDITLRVKLRGD